MHAALVLLILAGPASALDLRSEHFTVLAPPSRAAIAAELHDEAERVLEDVARQLGVSDIEQAPILVRILDSEAALRKAMPRSKVTDWAAGVAFPRSGLILLKVDHGTIFEIHDVFRHEISHVVLGRAVEHADLPVWFVEGVAVHQAGERILDRWRSTAQASLTDSVPPLRTIANGFPADRPTLVDLAYAQSTSFVTWLIDRRGWPGLRRVIARVREGQTFADAFANVYREPLGLAEERWLRDVRSTASWIPILGDQTVMWALVVMLFLFAYMVVRSRNRARLSRMEDPLDLDEFA